MINQDLVKFIIEARKRGFADSQIKEPLLKYGWPLKLIDSAFESLKTKSKSGKISETGYKIKNQVTLFLSNDILKAVDKRAKKNMLTVSEQIEDIIRRSCVNSKKLRAESEKLDDMFVGLFSRKRCGRTRKE